MKTKVIAIYTLFALVISGCGSPTLKYLEGPNDLDAIINELSKKPLDELSEREYNLLLASYENRNANLRARAKAEEAITERKTARTYQIVSCSAIVFNTLLLLFYIQRL